jgi:transposase
MKVPKSRGATGGADISVVHPHAAGIDIGAQFHVVAVGPGRDPEPVRSFRSFTKELHDLANWLKQAGVLPAVYKRG